MMAGSDYPSQQHHGQGYERPNTEDLPEGVLIQLFRLSAVHTILNCMVVKVHLLSFYSRHTLIFLLLIFYLPVRSLSASFRVHFLFFPPLSFNIFSPPDISCGIKTPGG